MIKFSNLTDLFSLTIIHLCDVVLTHHPWKSYWLVARGLCDTNSNIKSLMRNFKIYDKGRYLTVKGGGSWFLLKMGDVTRGVTTTDETSSVRA